MNLSLNSATKKLRYGDRSKPARDWFVLLVLFAIGLAASVAYNLLTFSSVTRGQAIGNAQPTVPPQIQLDQVNALFSQRAAARSRYDNQYSFVDPSL